MSVTIAFILDTRRVKKSNKYPVKLRVTYQRTSEYYQTIFDLSANDWKKLPAPRITEELQNIKDKLKKMELEAVTSLKKIDPFSHEEFEKLVVKNNPTYKTRKKKIGRANVEDSIEFDFNPFNKDFPILLEEHVEVGTIAYTYQAYIKKLIREERIGNASSYHCSYVSLKKFRGNVIFQKITSSYLFEYESWMKNKNASKTTIGIYLRALRAIFNEAINDGIIIKEKCYPFGLRKYIIPSSKKAKKALLLSEVQKIYLYEPAPDSTKEQQAKDYWLFSYFGNGMNPRDIANLRYKNIDGDYLIFERAKTERSQRNDPKQITAFINDDMKAIIKRWGNRNTSLNNYMFPILKLEDTALQQYHSVKSFVRFINDWMKVVLINIGMDKKVTTYVARHTFSTVLKRSGASTEFIQEALGHSDITTTESYLDSFDRETKREFASRLTSFKQDANVEIV